MSRVPARRMVEAARTLEVDATTAELLRAFQGAGCRAIILKGPTFQHALYRDGSRRSYLDTDLLVSPAELPRAAPILSELGFALAWDDRDHPGVVEPHAQLWERASGRSPVDLHWRIPGVRVAAQLAWDVLAATTEPVMVGGAVGESLDRPGIAMLVALHAAHHGSRHEKPLSDLERALDLIDAGIWAQAAHLAAELDASEAVAAGLRLAPAGARLAADLGLPAVRSPSRRLLASVPPPGSLGVLRIVEAPTARARAQVVRDALLPAPDFMRRVSPLARHGPIGLGLSYPARVLVRAWQLPAAIRAVRWSRGRMPPARRAP